MVGMASMEEHERKIVLEFCHLLEKSKQLFNGLRDLPQYGHKQWQAYFGRTFDIYTKLWKFQQQHRQTLDTKYGLKRWQIGEIASKIGQLYYHYYLRTSETNYLNEAYSFYAAIRGRAYYSRAAKEDRSELMVKKLRYYARFIVVCLLLRRMKLVRELVQELDRHIADYTSTYEPDDQLEWSLVLDEIKSFITADAIVSVIHADTNPIVLSHRLSPLTTPPVEKSQFMTLTLQEILIVGNCAEQVKFSELTMDMFRMLQTLEREPQDDFNHIYDASPAPNRVPYVVPGSKGYLENGDRPLRRENPHKYLLYKPTLSQVLVFLASGFKELPSNGALLLYLSADGCFSTTKHPEDMGYDLGGVLTSSKRDSEHKKQKEAHCLYPGDLYPFTRRPLFVIVDSDNSFVFQHIPRYFGQPLVTLMSPQDTPPAFQDQQHNGSLFTLFLHSPLTAFCYCCNLSNIPIHHWERCQSYVDRFVTEASRLFTRSRVGEYTEEASYLQFFGDDFLRLLLLRYVFCDVVLHLHRGFKGRQYRPRCQPPLPEAELLEHPSLQHLVFDLAAHLEMELGLWSTLWANCALGTTFLALPTVPVIGTDNQTIQIADDCLPQEHETVETQTVELSSSDSEESDAPDDSDKEAGDGEDVDIPENITDIQNNGSSSDSNSIQSGFDNNTETSTSVDNEVKVITRTGKRKKSYQRVRYSREEYKCTMCPYSCTTERAFLRHLRSHSTESDSKEPTPDAVPRLSCPVCGKDRSGEAALGKHMQKHRDNRHFCCDICSFKTVQLKKLIQHRRMHTGERPHLCPHCVYRAARRDNLRSHVRRVHKRDNLTCDTFSPRGMLLIPSAAATTSAKDD